MALNALSDSLMSENRFQSENSFFPSTENFLLFTSAFGIVGAALFAADLLLEDGAGLAFLLF